MPEEFHVLVKKFDIIDTKTTGHVLLELRFADIIIKLTNLTEEAISGITNERKVYSIGGYIS